MSKCALSSTALAPRGAPRGVMRYTTVSASKYTDVNAAKLNSHSNAPDALSTHAWCVCARVEAGCFQQGGGLFPTQKLLYASGFERAQLAYECTATYHHHPPTSTVRSSRASAAARSAWPCASMYSATRCAPGVPIYEPHVRVEEAVVGRAGEW